jgi:cytochrome b561
MPAEMWMFLVHVLAGIMLLVLALVAVNIRTSTGATPTRPATPWTNGVAAGEVLPRRNYEQPNANR